MPELPEVETIRRELEREVVGKRVKAVEVTGTPHRAPPDQEALHHAASRASRSPVSTARASTCCFGLDSGDVLVIHLRMSGQLLRAARQGPGAQAHPRGAHLHPGRSAALRRPAHLRRGVRRPPTTLDREMPELAELGIDPVDEPISWLTFGQLLDRRTDEAQGAPHGPVVHRRHRQHLQRRDPLRRRAALRPDDATRCRPRRSAASTGRWSRRCTRRSSTAARRWPTSSTSTSGKPGEYQEHHQVYDREGRPAAAAAATDREDQVRRPVDLLLRQPARSDPVLGTDPRLAWDRSCARCAASVLRAMIGRSGRAGRVRGEPCGVGTVGVRCS